MGRLLGNLRRAYNEGTVGYVAGKGQSKGARIASSLGNKVGIAKVKTRMLKTDLKQGYKVGKMGFTAKQASVLNPKHRISKAGKVAIKAGNISKVIGSGLRTRKGKIAAGVAAGTLAAGAAAAYYKSRKKKK